MNISHELISPPPGYRPTTDFTTPVHDPPLSVGITRSSPTRKVPIGGLEIGRPLPDTARAPLSTQRTTTLSPPHLHRVDAYVGSLLPPLLLPPSPSPILISLPLHLPPLHLLSLPPSLRYLLLNTAISSTWGFPQPCPDGCACDCYDCRKEECACAIPAGKYARTDREADIGKRADTQTDR